MILNNLIKKNLNSIYYGILLLSIFSCSDIDSECVYYRNTLKAENLDAEFVVMKIDVNCESCIQDIDRIAQSNTTKIFFISSISEKLKVKQKLKPYLMDKRFIIIEDKSIIDSYEDTFVNSYPSYYCYDAQCEISEVSLEDIL